MADAQLNKCPICEQPTRNGSFIESTVPYTEKDGLERRDHADVGYRLECASCGHFLVTRQDWYNIKNVGTRWEPYQLSALVRERSCSPLPKFWLQDGKNPYGPLNTSEIFEPINVEELIRRWPRTVAERLDRTLCSLANQSLHGGASVKWRISDAAVAFSCNEKEAIFTHNALVAQGLIESTIAPGAGNVGAIVTPLGWARVTELTRGKSSSLNPVFVAMWFGGKDHQKEMADLYTKGIEPAVQAAGYKVIRADLAEHNDWIMDQVLSGIQMAPFVIADFTEHRHGVYLEAGYARGLGLTVINTCRADHMGNAHFDTAQLNHIVWTNPEDLVNKLRYRILATVGQGPFAVEPSAS